MNTPVYMTCEHEAVMINRNHENDKKGKWLCTHCGTAFMPAESLVTIVEAMADNFLNVKELHGTYEDED